MNQDFVEMLAALSEAEADFLIVGAHAMAAYAQPRATGDLDIWVRPTPDVVSQIGIVARPRPNQGSRGRRSPRGWNLIGWRLAA